jgi:DNA-binding response OmpR family regulator
MDRTEALSPSAREASTPSLDAEPGPSSRQDAARARPAGPILVVDDDWQMREVIRQTLEDEGFVVEVAADGRQALDQAGRNRPAVLVLDMGLPLLDGYGVADGVRQLYADPPPILIVTADGRAAEKARKVRAAGYLSKPFDLDELCSAVTRILERS